jgi:hypothetical protein
MIRAGFVVFLVFVLSSLFGCAEKEELINYDELTAEELEILYNHGKTFVLPRLCNAYAVWYLERPEAEWWLEGMERKEEAGSKFIRYCEKAYATSKDKEAACQLKSYYLLNLEKKPNWLGEFLFYLKECGENKAYQAFVEHDAHFTAIAEHGLSVVNKVLESGEMKSDPLEVNKVVPLFNRYVTDLKQLESTVLVFSGEIHRFTLSLEDMALLLGKTGNDPRTKAMLKEFKHQLESETSFALKINKVVYAPENLNKDLLLKVIDALGDFKKNKEKYFSQYEALLGESGKK